MLYMKYMYYFGSHTHHEELFGWDVEVDSTDGYEKRHIDPVEFKRDGYTEQRHSKCKVLRGEILDKTILK